MSTELELINNLANKFLPIFVLHKKEKYLPLSFPTYVQGCKLVDLKKSTIIKDYPGLNVKDLKNRELDVRLDSFKPTKDIRLELVDMEGESMFGTPLDSDQKVDIYVMYNNIVFNGEDFIDLVYIIIYGFNEAPKSIFTPAKENHVWDLEFVTVRVKKSNETFVQMFFSAHGAGGWYKKEKNGVRFEEERPVVFIAKGSHSNWPTGGKHLRMLGFGNDYCADDEEPIENQRIFKPSVVVLTNYLQTNFPTKNYEYMSFVGSVSQNVSAPMPVYEPRQFDSLSYKGYKALELSGKFLQNSVSFDIKQILIIASIVLTLAILIIDYFVLKDNFTWKHGGVQFLIFILAVSMGFLTGYNRLFQFK
jgi:hypothetical protein